MNPPAGPVRLRVFPAEDLSWQVRALCARTPGPDRFFPEKGGSTREAKQVCRNCEVRAACLDYALRHQDIGRFGIWGGTSERERRRLKRRQFGTDTAAAVASVTGERPPSSVPHSRKAAA